MATELFSPGTLFAGQYGPEAIIGQNGSLYANGTVTIYDSDGTTVAAIYTDQTKATSAANPTTTDNYGNLKFFADPGNYILSFTVGGIATTLSVVVHPWYPDAAWNVVSVSANYTANSGDCVLANAASAALTITLPPPSLGARVRVIKTDTSANGVSVATPSGNILGPGGLSGAAFSVGVTTPATTVTADGTNYHATGIRAGLVPTQGLAVAYSNADTQVGLSGTENVNVVAASGASVTLPNPASYIGNDITLSADCAVTLPSALRGAFCYAVIRQAGTGGPFTATFAGGVVWPGGAVPAVSTGSGAIDRYDFVNIGTAWAGVVTGQAFA